MTHPHPTPHSHSHFQRRRPPPPFFEGWFLRLTLPDHRSFAFMFSIEQQGPGTLQLFDPADRLHIAHLGPVDQSRFYAHPSQFAIAHWAYANAAAGDVCLTRQSDFDKLVLQGYQVGWNATHGRVCGGQQHIVQWAFEYQVNTGWGKGRGGWSTATWLSRLPVFEPGYQVLIADGVVKDGGYVRVGDDLVCVDGARVYCEKNWGAGFPKRWWWVQCNMWHGVDALSLTTLGAVRKVAAWEEEVGLIAVHFGGDFYEFANWNCESLHWEVEGWGSWKVWGRSANGYTVELEARTEEQAVDVLGPSAKGMIYNVRDNARGSIRLTLRDPCGDAVLDGVQSTAAQVEVGGEKWTEPWKAGVRKMPQPLRGLVNIFHRPGARTAG
eukprot:GFKZ01004774.1.p1 GENE.GFKZ01004774.1~~GFKZ01004774.1.p1  ORF type:complete len:419 (-),score=27.23 GFKZ01004774.1:808-1950(-)